MGAVLENWDAWGNSGGVTQVLTRHGCFEEYLCRIKRERDAHCHHCGADRDTAQHTLVGCRAWCSERRVLVASIGDDLSIPAMIRALLAREDKKGAVIEFYEQVMLQKEAAGRDRERTGDPSRVVGEGRGGSRVDSVGLPIPPQA